jgi:signal transduction histidine kinase
MAVRDWPIRQKLMAILLLTNGVVLALTCAAFLTYEFATFRQASLAQLSALARVIAANSTASLAFRNEADATEILSALRAQPNVVAAALYDQSGQLFAHYPANITAAALPPIPGADGYRFEQGNAVGFTRVAQQGDTRLGTLYLASDLTAIHDTFRLAGAIALAILALSFAAAYLMSRFLQGTISQPIVTLVETARAVSDRQDYSVRAPHSQAGELDLLTDAFNHMLARIEEQSRVLQQNEENLRRYAGELEERVAERTAALEERNEGLRRNAAELLSANQELDAFAYSVSHDLRAPLRSIDGFSQILLQDYGERLDDAGKDFLQRVRKATQRMGALIDDLLSLARITRAELRAEAVDLSGLVGTIAGELQQAMPGRDVELAIAPGLTAHGDVRLLRVALENLLRNSWKYTARQPHPRVEFGSTDANGARAFLIRDNGAGFDMQYVDKLFGAFQRLHSADEFEGTGVGLATVRRIITRHGGRIWAEGEVGRGATFYFTLS